MRETTTPACLYPRASRDVYVPVRRASPDEQEASPLRKSGREKRDEKNGTAEKGTDFVFCGLSRRSSPPRTKTEAKTNPSPFSESIRPCFSLPAADEGGRPRPSWMAPTFMSVWWLPSTQSKRAAAIGGYLRNPPTAAISAAGLHYAGTSPTGA
jgi:hypothetical protein